jgi:hypothetical protein
MSSRIQAPWETQLGKRLSWVPETVRTVGRLPPRSHLRISTPPRRAGRPRLTDRCLHRLDHPASRRDRPLTTAARHELVAVPPGAGTGGPGLRLVSPRHHHPAPAVRVLRHRARHPTGTHPPATPDPQSGRSAAPAPPADDERDEHHPTARPTRRTAPRVSAGRVRCAEFLAPTGTHMQLFMHGVDSGAVSSPSGMCQKPPESGVPVTAPT